MKQKGLVNKRIIEFNASEYSEAFLLLIWSTT